MDKIKYEALENSADDADSTEIISIVDDNNSMGMVAYRVVQVSNDVDMDSPMTETNTLTTNSLNPQCQYYVIKNTNEYVKPSRTMGVHTSPNSRSTGTTPVKKRDDRKRANHNEIERRRRDKINNWIMELGKIIPNDNTTEVKTVGHIEGLSKGGILAKACEYITELKETNNNLSECLKNNEQLLLDNGLLKETNDKLKKENELLKKRLHLLATHKMKSSDDLIEIL